MGLSGGRLGASPTGLLPAAAAALGSPLGRQHLISPRSVHCGISMPPAVESRSSAGPLRPSPTKMPVGGELPGRRPRVGHRPRRQQQLPRGRDSAGIASNKPAAPTAAIAICPLRPGYHQPTACGDPAVCGRGEGGGGGEGRSSPASAPKDLAGGSQYGSWDLSFEFFECQFRHPRPRVALRLTWLGCWGWAGPISSCWELILAHLA
jgi:hypothetical protein